MNSIYTQIESLKSEITKIQTTDYSVEYKPVKPMSYLIFYYISGALLLIITVLFIVFRKKEANKVK